MEYSGLVTISRVEKYDPAMLRKAIDRQFALLGVEELLRPGMKVVFKPNLLAARKPEQAVTTHPMVVEAAADWFLARGITDITLADSPGGLYTEGLLKGIYQTCGLRQLEDRIKLNTDVTWVAKSREAGKYCKSFNLIRPIAQADLVVNLAKVKTHGMTTLSAGMKNLFGCVPGLQKPELHYRYPNQQAFAGMLVDLDELVAPAVTVLDGIVAMEGDGPSSGTPRQMGCLFAARDLYAQDWTVAQAMGLEPDTVPMLKEALERGLVCPEKIRLEGDPMPQLEPFRLPRGISLDFVSKLPPVFRRPARALMDRILRPTPKIDLGRCVGCGKCAESCPPHTIEIRQGKAHINLKNCISCFCCQEMCPVHVISVRRIVK